MSRQQPDEGQNALPMQQPNPQQLPVPGGGEGGAPLRRKKRRASAQPLSRSARQRRQVRRSKRRRLARRLAFLTLTLGMAFLAVTVFFRVDKLRVTGTQHYSAEEITKSLGVQQGDNLFSFRTQALEKRLLKQYPYLSRVDIQRQLPDGLVVRAVDAVPVVAIDAAGGGSFLVDATGKLLEQTASIPQGVAPVTGVLLDEGKPGQKLEGDGTRAVLLRLMRALKDADILGDVDFINVSAAYDVRFGYLGRLDVRLGEVTGLAEKLRLLRRVVEEELSPSDVCIVHLADPTTAYCPPATIEQIEQSMLPLEDVLPMLGADTQDS